MYTPLIVASLISSGALALGVKPVMPVKNILCNNEPLPNCHMVPSL